MFKPTLPQSKFKASLYARFKDKLDWSVLDGIKLQTLTGSRSVAKWWDDDEQFRDWVQEKDTVDLMLKSSAEISIDRLRDIVLEDSVGPTGRVTAASQVAAARLLLEFAGYAPASHKVIEYRDKEIEKMSEVELRDYVRKNIHLVK